MEKFPCYEYVAGCSADGKLRMTKHCADAFIESRRDFIRGIDGTKRYHEWLALGAMCEELHRDRKSTRLNSSHHLTSRMPSSA